MTPTKFQDRQEKKSKLNVQVVHSVLLIKNSFNSPGWAFALQHKGPGFESWLEPFCECMFSVKEDDDVFVHVLKYMSVKRSLRKVIIIILYL